MKYDECGNVRETKDGRLNTTAAQYYLSAADNAYAFLLRVTNPLGHQVNATYSYKSGVPLTRTDANGKVTTMLYDTRDRVVQVQKPSGGKKFIVYSDRAFCQYMCGPSDIPYATITEEITSTTSRDYRVQVDVMGRVDETTIFDSGGNIKTNTEYDAFQQPYQVDQYRDGQSHAYRYYSYGAPGYLGSVTAPDQSWISYGYDRNYVSATADNGFRRRYTYQEDGKVSQVREEDGNNQLTLNTNYAYDALGRLLTITQGVQTRSFTYDALGRLKSETHPESGTTTYTYDANSNLLTRTDARGVTTSNTYDALNRVTLRSYSDGTPSVSYFYDSQPTGSPITIQNPVGRLTRVTTTTSGVAVTNYHSYCNCSSVEREATVIIDGTTKTYTTSYAYDYLGQLTSITYPNGKIVTTTRDSKGREIKVSSTVLGQPADYVKSAAYLGPRGELTQVDHTIWQSTYTYSPYTLRLTDLYTLGVSLSFEYVNHPNPYTYEYGSRIYDILDNYDHSRDQHFEYDELRRLTSYWQANGRFTEPPGKKINWTYDRYGNMLTKTSYGQGYPPEGGMETFTVDAATNRVTAWSSVTYSYDAAGNRTGGGRSYDAENRLLGYSPGYPNPSVAFLYDGNSHRFRKTSGSTKIFYVYSVMGFMLVEDDWTAGTTQNQIYFNGQLIATHDQDEYVRLLFKDHLGSTRSIATVMPLPGYPWGFDWETTAVFSYNPYGDYASSWTYWDTQLPKVRFTGKEREGNGLDYFGARYYDSSPTHRWISADRLTARIYDPLSLNKYSYVRNDPVNLIGCGSFGTGDLSHYYERGLRSR